MSIEGIRLENFRGFQNAPIKIEPLTVLLGANSSGKSSFGHAMAAMAHAQTKYEGTQRATLTPEADANDWPVDLGTLSDLRTHGASGSVFVTLKTSAGSVKWGFGFDPESPETQGLIVSHIEWPKGRGHSDSKVIVLEPHSISLPNDSTITQLASVVLDQNEQVYRTFKRLNLQQWRELPEDVALNVDLNGLVIDSVMQHGRTSEPINIPVLNETREFLKNLTYLRATRRRPTRVYDESKSGLRQSVGYSGEKVAHVLHRSANDPVMFLVPPVIQYSMPAAKEVLNQKWEERSSTLIDALNFWLQHLQLAASINTIRRADHPTSLQIVVNLPGQQAHDITEVGFGVSQILPVLVAGLLQPKSSIFIVDLPEAHLHPWPQAQLADFFCSLALGGKRVLVETHSEMFINQLRLRAELTEDVMQQSAVYSIDSPRNGRCCSPILAELGAQGEMCWPAGFMQEALNVETAIRAVRAAKRRHVE